MSDALFRQKAPAIMRALQTEFPELGAEDVAAVLGNIGGETGGFQHMQELRPVVAGSRGGYGWCQWTGVRRRQFEAWCREQGVLPSSDEANLGFLCHELRTSERRTLPALMNAQGLRAKVIAFERTFERAGIPHHDGRVRWAKIALSAFAPASRTDARDAGEELPAPEPMPDRLSAIEVEAAQQQLKALGYHEIGLADGRWGSRSTAALSAFQHDRGLPITGRLDAEAKFELDQAAADGFTRPIAPERAEGTPENSRIMTAAGKQQATGVVATAGAFFTWLMSTVSDYLEPVRGVYDLARPVLKPFVAFAVDHWLLLIVAAGGVVIWQGFKIKAARREDHRTGKTA